VTSSGEPPSGARDAAEADWIDQILERATRQAGVPAPAEQSASQAPIVPEPAPVEPLVVRTSVPADGLAEIRWVDAPQVTPASTPIVTPNVDPRPAPQPTPPTHDVGALVPEAVGRSAWDEQLATLGDSEPEGWDQLSWEDLDEGAPSSRRVQEDTSFSSLLREWGPVLFAAFAIAVFTRLVLVQAYHIPSESMVPTLEDGDRVVVNRLSYRFGEIERGQVVVFAKPLGTDGENDLIKRVIGLPGETIQFVDNQVYINGFRVEETYLLEQDSTRPRLTIPGCDQIEPARDLCVIPEGHVFVMGDNRLGSSDSRVFGPIEIDSVVGRAFMRVWPLNNLGQL